MFCRLFGWFFRPFSGQQRISPLLRGRLTFSDVLQTFRLVFQTVFRPAKKIAQFWIFMPKISTSYSDTAAAFSWHFSILTITFSHHSNQVWRDTAWDRDFVAATANSCCLRQLASQACGLGNTARDRVRCQRDLYNWYRNYISEFDRRWNSQNYETE